MITIDMIPFKNALRQTGGGKFADQLKDSVQLSNNPIFSDFGISHIELKIITSPYNLGSRFESSNMISPVRSYIPQSIDLKTLFEEIYPKWLIGQTVKYPFSMSIPAWLSFGSDGFYHLTSLNNYTDRVDVSDGSQWSFYRNDWVAVKTLAPIKDLISPSDFQNAINSTGHESGASVFSGNLRTAFISVFAITGAAEALIPAGASSVGTAASTETLASGVTTENAINLPLVESVGSTGAVGGGFGSSILTGIETAGTKYGVQLAGGLIIKKGSELLSKPAETPAPVSIPNSQKTVSGGGLVIGLLGGGLALLALL